MAKAILDTEAAINATNKATLNQNQQVSLFDAAVLNICQSIGRIFIVMKSTSEKREVIGTGTGTVIKNDGKKIVILTCAHFAESMQDSGKMKNYKNHQLEIYFFPNIFLQDCYPIGTQGANIPFEKYKHLKALAIYFPNGTSINDEPALEKGIRLPFDEIEKIRTVKEGKKDFALICLDANIKELVPLQIEAFHDLTTKFFSAGHPSWGLSDCGFAVVCNSIKPQEGKKIFFDFPAMHGMSGGPIYYYDKEENQFSVIGVLIGINQENLFTIGYPLSESDIKELTIF